MAAYRPSAKMSSSEEDDDALAGLSLPKIGAPAGGAEEEDDDEAPSPPQPAELGAEEDGEEDSEEEEEAGPTGVSAEQAFASNTMDSLELDPFRRAAGADVPDREAEATGEKGKKGKKLGYVAQVHRTHMDMDMDMDMDLVEHDYRPRALLERTLLTMKHLVKLDLALVLRHTQLGAVAQRARLALEPRLGGLHLEAHRRRDGQ